MVTKFSNLSNMYIVKKKVKNEKKKSGFKCGEYFSIFSLKFDDFFQKKYAYCYRIFSLIIIIFSHFGKISHHKKL